MGVPGVSYPSLARLTSKVARCVETAPVQSPALVALRDTLHTGDGTASRAIALLARLSEWKDVRGNPIEPVTHGHQQSFPVQPSTTFAP